MENINEPLMSFNEWESVNPQICDLIKEYANYHTQWHFKQAEKYVCDKAQIIDVQGHGIVIVIDKQSITNAFKNYITNNLK